MSAEVERLRKKSDENLEQEKGASHLWRYIVGAVGVAAAVIAMLK